jgi:flagella basal body P-ring formation protein FlgA
VIFLFSPDEGIKKEVEKYIRTRFPGYEIYEFQIMNLPDEFKKIQITDSSVPSSSSIKNVLSIPVKIRRKDGSTYNSVLSVKVKFYQKVYTCQRNIDRKENLTENDFEIKVFDVTSLNGTGGSVS